MHRRLLVLTSLLALAPSVAWAHDAEIEAPHTDPSDVNAPDSPPTIVDRKDPAYPSKRLNEEHGEHARLPELDVEVEVSLDEKGALVDARILVSGGADFDAEALAAFRSWTYQPARRGGAAVPSVFHIPIHFEPPPHEEPVVVDVVGRKSAPSRGISDYRIPVGALARVPRKSAADYLRLSPSVFLLKDGGGEGHADRIYLRGFDAREGQDVELTIDGIPVNESSNYHGAGFADLNVMIPELVSAVRVLQGPFDPRQGNYAVAGSADYTTGLAERGLTAKATYGSWNTFRFLGLWGPQEESERTYAGAEIYRTDGYGDNREAWRARVMGQYEGRLGDAASFRLSALGYVTEYQSAGVLREEDVESGRKDFYGTNDTSQGGSAMRFHVGFDVEARESSMTYGLQTFGIFRSMRLLENFTGFLLDEQLGRQQPHGQRGDLLDLDVTAGTVGMRAFGRHGFELFDLAQEAELGLYARGDMGSNLQQRVGRATDAPYLTEADFDSKLADIGLYADLTARLLPWLTLRGGVRVDLFAYDVQDNCAVKDVSRPPASNPPGDASCLSMQRFGEHREPNQHSTTASILPLPRVSAIFGPFDAFTISTSYGKGSRTVDASYITDGVDTPFAEIDAWDVGVGYGRTFDDFTLTASTSFFVTHVTRDQIFNETEGRSTLAEGTTRAGGSLGARLTGTVLDTNLNASIVKSRFDDTGLLVPYVPDLIVRSDTALFHDLFDLDASPVRGRVGVGISLVGERALPSGERSDVIFLLDASTSVAWRFLELEVSGTNLANLDTKQAEFNYVSDFEPNNPANLVAARHFAAGAPLGVFGTLSATLGGGS